MTDVMAVVLLRNRGHKDKSRRNALDSCMNALSTQSEWIRKVAMNCVVCNEPVHPDRWAIGYHYCMKKECAAAQPTKLDNYRLILVPKQGFTFVDKDSPHLLDGKSSGR